MKKLTALILALAMTFSLTVSSVRAFSVTEITIDPVDQDHDIFAASYTSEGQMLSLAQLDGANATYQIPTDAAYMKLFWLDSNGTPLSESSMIAPGSEVSAAMLLTLVGQTVFSEIAPTAIDWYGPYLLAAEKAGWFTGTNIRADAPFAPVSRYDMAAVLDAAVKFLGFTIPDSDVKDIRGYADIPENYRAAVGRVYALGLVQLDETGNFNGGNSMTCADALIILTRLPQLASQAESLDAELRAAFSLGLLPGMWIGVLDEPVSFSEYKHPLDSLIRLCGTVPQKDDWAAAVDVSCFPERETLRSDGLVLLMVAADVLGYNVYNARDYGFCTENRVDFDRMFQQCNQDFSYCTPRPITLYFPNGSPDGDAFELPQMAAVFWMQRRMDLSQRVHFFDYDGDLDFHLDRPLTRDAAVRAVLRLYQSEALEYDSHLITRQPTELDEKILADAEAIKTSILQNTDDPPCSGTAYYVSNFGSDSADGRTPETAWATLDRVNRAELSAGDGVYFQRGGLWRGQLLAQEGVTYSAYGQGEKPRFYASTENGAGAEKWSLLEGTDNIWVYHRDLMDCGNLVFNEGEAWGRKIAPHYLNGYRATADFSQPFDVRAELVNDLDFFSEADSILYDGAPFRYTVMDTCDRGEYPEDVVGTLYLRCDQGNPGEIFNSIEFMERQNLIVPADRAVFNNLSLKYCGAHAIFGGDIGYDVSFCEIGWIGGTIQYYTYGDGEPALLGNGVECDGSYSGFSVTDCYIYQCYDAGVSNQDPSESPDVTGNPESFGRDVIQRDITYARNVFSYIDMPVEIFFTLADGEDGCRHTMENVRISDNYILYTGYGWYAGQKPAGAASCYQTHSTPNHAENFRIENNVFYLSVGPLLNLRMNSSSRPIFSGNTYVQNPDGVLVTDWNGGKQYFFDETAAATVYNRLGDSTGILAD